MRSPAEEDHCLARAPAAEARMFGELPPLAGDRALLLALGRGGGACDGGPVDREGDDAAEAAGWPLFAQFVLLDLTAGAARLDLECVYGPGPARAPFLYDRRDPARLLVGRNDAGAPEDLPRNAQGVALAADPRADLHLFVSQLWVAFLKLHNGLVDRARAEGTADAFGEARRLVRWHYQWIVLNDYLPRAIGRERARRLLAGKARAPEGAALPREFAHAAFRYGHGQLRRRYMVNDRSGPLPLLPDLAGFRHVPASRVVDWRMLFDTPGAPPAQRAKRIDGTLARWLMELPAGERVRSLATRDLERGAGLPSGEAVARALGEEPLGREETRLGELGWEGETPLWYYLLREAAVREGGDRLGPAGAAIVGQVLVGVVDADPESYRRAAPYWRPSLPAAGPHAFGLADALACAVAMPSL